MEIFSVVFDWVCADCGEDRQFELPTDQIPATSGEILGNDLLEVRVECADCGSKAGMNTAVLFNEDPLSRKTRLLVIL